MVITGGSVYFLSGNDNKEEQANAAVETVEKKTWNPYAEETNHLVTLSDFILSAGQGDFVVKMSLTLDFNGEESYYKFKGKSTLEETEEKSGGHGKGSDDDHITPMEIVINDEIGKLMLSADENTLYDKTKLKSFLLDGVNKKLDLNENILNEIYIENYIIQ